MLAHLVNQHHVTDAGPRTSKRMLKILTTLGHTHDAKARRGEPPPRGIDATQGSQSPVPAYYDTTKPPSSKVVVKVEILEPTMA